MRSWFLDFWREKEENPKRTNQLRLRPRQLKRLLGDSSVRTELQNARLAGLLPPVGTEVFRRFTPASLQDAQQRGAKETEKLKESKEVEKELHKEDPHLEEGKPLPFVYGDPPPELLYRPLEELDPFYQSQKTFIVLSKGNLLHRFNAEPSCLLLSPLSRLRSLAVRILVHSWFRLFLMATILTNCVFMIINAHTTASRTAEFVFAVVYVFEVVVKILSRGFCVGRFTFLRDPWNWLDIMVVMTAFLPEFLDLGKLSALRTIPRVLKIIAVYPGVKSSAAALFQSVRRLMVVVAMTVAMLLIMTLIGQHFFMGYMRQKCVKMWSPSNWTDDDFISYHDNGSTHFDYMEFINNKENHFPSFHHSEALLCGNRSDTGACPHGYICLRTSTNPDNGYTSFDSFGLSLLTVIRLMTHDNWQYLLEEMMQSGGTFWSVKYVLCVFFVGFCLLIHVLVGIAIAVVEQEKADVAEARRTKEEFLHIVDVIKKKEEEKEEEETLDDQRSSACLSAGTCDCCGCWQWLRQRVNSVVMNPFFDFVIVICLVLNCIMMATDHYPMTYGYEEFFLITSLVFTAIFTAEMILRLVAMNPCNYFRVGWHIYDSIIVVLSVLELFIVEVPNIPEMRALRLARWWPALHMFLKIIWSSVRALWNLTLILLTMVFLFAVVGMQLFQADYSDDVCRISESCQLPRWHMNDLYHTFVLNFRIFCGEWIESLWDCMKVSTPSVCLMYFMSVLVIGHLLVLNLFLVLLMNLVSDDLVPPKDKEKNNCKLAIDQIKKLLRKKNPIIPQHKVVNSEEDTKESLGLKSMTSDQPPSHPSSHGNQTRLDMPENEEEKHRDEDSKTTKEHTPEDCCCCNRCCPFLDIDTSQGSGKIWSNFRRVCFLIVQHKYFEGFIIFIIILSSAVLVLESIQLQQHLNMFLDTAEHLFTFIFLLEMLLKWAALGFKKYFTSFWCWLDFLILAVSLISLNLGMLGYSELGAGLSLRTLRSLRPLRILSRFQCLRLVLSTLVAIVPYMCEAMLVCLFVLLMFSTMGVFMLAGKFYACVNETEGQMFLPTDVANMSECFSLMEANISEIGWKNGYLNFDHVSAGFWSLLQVATSNGWLGVMHRAVDSTQVQSQPAYESNVYMYIYFICFIIFGCFFMSNLFIRVFIHSLDQLRHKFGGKHFFMTDEQQIFSIRVKNWFSTKRPGVPRPQNRCQASLFDLVSKRAFEIVKVIVICLNLVALMVETYDQSIEKEFILHWMHFVFIIFFLIECILKLIAFRKHYFSDCFNVLDFVVIIFSVLGVFIADLLEKYFVNLYVLPVVRCAHLVRVIHLIPYVRGIRKLFVAFVMSLPAVFNICLLLFLLMFTFSVFGMLSFAPVRANDVLNFETFSSSMICMFTITMMDGWEAVISPTLRSQQACEPDKVMMGSCVHPTVSIIFFICYISLSLLMVVLLYAAVVLETLNMYEAETPSDEDLQMFYKTWSRFDRDTSHVIPYSELSDFCDALQAPLRIPKPNALKLIHMDLPLLPGDKIHCVDILHALTVQRFGDQGQMDALKARMEEKFKIQNLSKMNEHEPISSTLQRKQQEVAATVIQKAFRKHRLTDRDADEKTAEPAGGAAAV